MTVLWSELATWQGLLEHPSNPHNLVTEKKEVVEAVSWDGAELPPAGSNVWIPSWMDVIMDLSPPNLNWLIIEVP